MGTTPIKAESKVVVSDASISLTNGSSDEIEVVDGTISKGTYDAIMQCYNSCQEQETRRALYDVNFGF